MKTVGDLKKELKDLPDDWPVYLSSDAEGNDYNVLMQVTLAGKFNPKDRCFDAKEGEDADCIVLYPTD
jgi:hypothetical protein